MQIVKVHVIEKKSQFQPLEREGVKHYGSGSATREVKYDMDGNKIVTHTYDL